MTYEELQNDREREIWNAGFVEGYTIGFGKGVSAALQEETHEERKD